jgi:hypothetical protein
MLMRLVPGRALAAAVSLAALASPALAQSTLEPITKDDVIVGTMDIQFNTRTGTDTSGTLAEGSPVLGSKDIYSFKIDVVETLGFQGKITRQPNLFSKIIGSKKQNAQLWYDVSLIVRMPSDLKVQKTVGKWVGTTGNVAAFKEMFTGYLVGKAEKKENLLEQTYKRVVGNKTYEIKLKKSDPMRFENVVLAKGPVGTFPTSTVNGTLNYDYETGNYFADNITFNYNLNGKDYTDVLTGTIKWVEDPMRKTNGKGHYEFNLRFNEEKNKAPAGEAAAFAKMSDEEAFFAVDNTVPTLTGKVAYVDTMSSDEMPTSSKITYNLNANKLNKVQVVNFFKLWLIAVGPTNDE